MARFFLGDQSHGVAAGAIAKQFPLFGSGHPVLYWAAKGLVKFKDEREDLPPMKRYGAMPWQKAAKHILAISEMVVKSSEDVRWSRERQILQKFICEMEEVIKQARAQGGPLDGQAVRNEYARRRPTSVMIPKIVNMDLPPARGAGKRIPTSKK